MCDSDLGFGFKNEVRTTIPWFRELPQRSVFFTTSDNGRCRPDEGSASSVGSGVGGTAVVLGREVTHRIRVVWVWWSSSILGLIRGVRVFTVVLPTWILVSRL